MRMSSSLSRILVLSLILIVTGGAGSSIFSFRAYHTEDLAFRGENNDIVEARLFIPDHCIKPYHTVISLHSIFQDERLLTSMTRSLMRDGYTVMIIHFKGYSHTLKRHNNFNDYCSGTKAAITYLQGRGDTGAISLMGHSIGANLACTVAMQLKEECITSVVAIGFPVDAGLRSPSNVLFMIGLLDELHPVKEMKEVLKNATGENTPEISKLYGGFKDGTARKLSITLLSDHYLEVFDPFFFSEAARWMALSAGVSNPRTHLPFDTCALLFYSLFLSGAMLITALSLVTLYRHLHEKAAQTPEAAQRRKRLLSISFVAFAGLLWSIGLFTSQQYWKDSAFIAVFSLMVINGVAAWHRDSFPDDECIVRLLKRSILYGAVIWLSVCVGVVINRIDFLFLSPRYMVWVPMLALFSIPVGLFVFISKCRFILTQALPSGALLLTLLALEILIPGRIGSAIAQFFTHLLSSIKKIDLQIKMKSSPASLILLFICVGAAILVWRQILGEGYDFSSAAVTGLILLVAKLFFIPLFLIFLIFRSRAFNRLDERLSGTLPADRPLPGSATSSSSLSDSQ